MIATEENWRAGRYDFGSLAQSDDVSTTVKVGRTSSQVLRFRLLISVNGRIRRNHAVGEPGERMT